MIFSLICRSMVSRWGFFWHDDVENVWDRIFFNLIPGYYYTLSDDIIGSAYWWMKKWKSTTGETCCSRRVPWTPFIHVFLSPGCTQPETFCLFLFISVYRIVCKGDCVHNSNRKDKRTFSSCFFVFTFITLVFKEVERFYLAFLFIKNHNFCLFFGT